MTIDFVKLAKGFGLFNEDSDYENPYVKKHFAQMDMAAEDNNSYAIWYHWCKIAVYDKQCAKFVRQGFAEVVHTIIRSIDIDTGINTFIMSPSGRMILNHGARKKTKYNVAEFVSAI